MTALGVRRPRRSAPARDERAGVRFTGEQRAAIEDRKGSALLAANAGSGKTAVMVERFVEAVLHDDVPVGAVLALTFTEKAAGELRERVRRRFVALGEHERAREADAAWISTIHGFCARILRARPLAAGLDPRFTVLDEAAAKRLADQAYERALENWAAARGAPAVDLAAAYGPTLSEIVLAAHEGLRSRGEGRPRLAIPPEPPVPDPAQVLAARATAAASLALAGAGKKVSAAREALDACERLAGAGDVPMPGLLDPGKLGAGAKALEDDACVAYRTAWEEYRAACADHHARAALVLLDDLLDRFDGEYAAAKAARAGVDFSDLELRVRDLLADPGARREWSERFALIMVDEFQDTNRLQLDVLEALERDTEPPSAAGTGTQPPSAAGTGTQPPSAAGTGTQPPSAAGTGNLFAVGDEFQSIYRFRHADVTIFRERRERLGAGRVRRLARNFRSREELLDVLNGAFAGELGERFGPLIAGRETPDVPLRLFDPDPVATGEPPVELLITDSAGWDGVEVGLSTLAPQPARRAEARLIAQRLREEVDAGRRPGDIVVLVRATASLRLLEQALEEQNLPTYVLGGRGYWSQEQVRDGISYLAALANPRDETALFTALASPFCGAGADALVLLAAAGREGEARGAWAALRAAAGLDPESPAPGTGEATASPAPGTGEATASPAPGTGEATASPTPGPGRATASPTPGPGLLDALPEAERARLVAFAKLFAAERPRAERASVEVLLERAIVVTGYDLAILARAGGERRLANLRKLMRLAREYEAAEGPDLRGFLAYAATQDLAQAREGEAALESDGLDAVRLMTVHRAKGLEFPVVCVADLGRAAANTRSRLLLGRDGTVGLRLAPIGGGEAIPALGWDRLARAEQEAEAEEERRLFYVAMTRARERLILSGCVDCERLPEPRPGGPPIDWISRALVDDVRGALAESETVTERRWEARPARVLVRRNAPDTLGTVLRHASLAPADRPRAGAPGTALPEAPVVLPDPPSRPRPAPQRLSYSSLGAYARCGYRFYLERVLRLPPVAPPGEAEAAEVGAAAAGEAVAAEVGAAAAGEAVRGEVGAEDAPVLAPALRGTLVHRLLEDLDFARPAAPDLETVAEVAAGFGVEPPQHELEDVRELVGAFADSPLRERLAAARRTRREAPFSFGLDPGGGGPLVTGFLDVVATEPDGGVLIVDYKSDRLEGGEPSSVVDRDYATQRIVYALAALRGGAPRAEVAYCFLERPDAPVQQAFTPADAPALAERLQELAAGVIAGSYPVTPTPHRDLCADCPGRATLCSYPEERTLQPA